MSMVMATAITAGYEPAMIIFYHGQLAIWSNYDNGKVTIGSKFDPTLLIQ